MLEPSQWALIACATARRLPRARNHDPGRVCWDGPHHGPVAAGLDWGTGGVLAWPRGLRQGRAEIGTCRPAPRRRLAIAAWSLTRAVTMPLAQPAAVPLSRADTREFSNESCILRGFLYWQSDCLACLSRGLVTSGSSRRLPGATVAPPHPRQPPPPPLPRARLAACRPAGPGADSPRPSPVLSLALSLSLPPPPSLPPSLSLSLPPSLSHVRTHTPGRP